MFKGNTKDFKTYLKEKDRHSLIQLLDTRKKAMKDSMPARKEALKVEKLAIEKQIKSLETKKRPLVRGRHDKYSSDSSLSSYEEPPRKIPKPSPSVTYVPGFDSIKVKVNRKLEIERDDIVHVKEEVHRYYHNNVPRIENRR